MTGTVNLDVDIQARLQQLRSDGAPIQEALSGISDQWHGWLDSLSGLQELLRSAQQHRAAQESHGARLLTTPAVRRVPEPAVEEAPQPSGNAPTTTPEDEAFLASLDEHTASLLRVRRRLSMNTKSFQECLAEVQQERATPKKGVSKKGNASWWS